MDEIKVIIAGGRDFDNYEHLMNACDYMLQNCGYIEVVSGGAKGADILGEKYAYERGYPVKRFPADWDKHGKSAGYKRNVEMADYADALIAFWDGKSKGTKHMIDIAKNKKLKVKIYGYTI